jgi:hypothetical protein
VKGLAKWLFGKWVAAFVSINKKYFKQPKLLMVLSLKVT